VGQKETFALAVSALRGRVPPLNPRFRCLRNFRSQPIPHQRRRGTP